MQLAQVSVPYTDNIAQFRFTSSDNLVGNVVSRLLLYSIILGGMIFFVKLVMAGYGYLTSAGDSNKIAAASKNLVNAAIGLFLIFITFFIAQILQVILGINIL